MISNSERQRRGLANTRSARRPIQTQGHLVEAMRHAAKALLTRGAKRHSAPTADARAFMPYASAT